LSVVRYISQRVAVMYLGNIVEIGKTEDLFNNPCHPYTKALLDAVPVIDPQRKIYQFKPVQSSDWHSSENSGCPFFNRCAQRKNECRAEIMMLFRCAGEEVHFCAFVDINRLSFTILKGLQFCLDYPDIFRWKSFCRKTDVPAVI